MTIQILKQNFKRLLPMIVYMILYMVWFTYLENTVTTNYHLIHMKLDDYIPFIEAFIIPYEMWFFYVASTIIFLLFTDFEEYKNTCFFICFGMTLFLIVSTIYPNGHDLRLSTMPRDNVLTRLVVHLQQTDTPTNLFPSIHVFNSIGMNIGLHRCKKLKNHRWVKVASSILCISIILSTMFIKQHSVFDVFTAFGCAIVFYSIVYKTNFISAVTERKQKEEEQKEAVTF